MPKYLLQATYTSEGLLGLMKDKAAGRKVALQALAKSVKAKLDCMYFAFGTDDVVAIVDAPDNAAAAAMSVAASSSGLVSACVTPLLTIEEMDSALALAPKYRAPGE